METSAFPHDAVRTDECFDAVVSNPPYIPASMIDALEPEVREYEPRQALVGGADGLAMHTALLRHSAGRLVRGGLLAVEVMAGQLGEVAGLAARIGGWSDPEVIPDLADIPRVLIWTREGDRNG
jgi:release factor glutamine methyltransferase